MTIRILPIRRQDGRVCRLAAIDAEEFGRLGGYRWHLHSKGYVARKEIVDGKRRTIFLHREVLGLVPGDGMEGDHKNGNKLDNRQTNLRVVTHAQNGQNRSGGYGSSQHRGVCWSKQKGKWVARVGQKLVGLYDDEQEAADAASEARSRLMTHALS